MIKEIVAFGIIEIEKQKFYHRKNLILLKDVHTKKILISSMVSFDEKQKVKYFIGYKDDDLELNQHTQFFETRLLRLKFMMVQFLIKDDYFLKKCNDIWNKVSNIVKKELDCE